MTYHANIRILTSVCSTFISEHNASIPSGLFGHKWEHCKKFEIPVWKACLATQKFHQFPCGYKIMHIYLWCISHIKITRILSKKKTACHPLLMFTIYTSAFQYLKKHFLEHHGICSLQITRREQNYCGMLASVNIILNSMIGRWPKQTRS